MRNELLYVGDAVDKVLLLDNRHIDRKLPVLSLLHGRRTQIRHIGLQLSNVRISLSPKCVN